MIMVHTLPENLQEEYKYFKYKNEAKLIMRIYLKKIFSIRNYWYQTIFWPENSRTHTNHTYDVIIWKPII